MDKNKKMIDNFQKILLQSLKSDIGGYLWKRNSIYFDKKKKAQQKGLFKSMFEKVSSKYEKRYFKLNIKDETFSYSKNE